MDDDLGAMSEQELRDEVRRLRQGIRAHRDSTGHELCWHHPDLWALLPEGSEAIPVVPEWPQFIRGCIRYRESLDHQLAEAARTDAEFDDMTAATAPESAAIPTGQRAPQV